MEIFVLSTNCLFCFFFFLWERGELEALTRDGDGDGGRWVHCVYCTVLDCTRFYCRYVCTYVRYVCKVCMWEVRVLFFKEGRVRLLWWSIEYFFFSFFFSFLPSLSSLLIYFVVGSFGLGRCYMFTCRYLLGKGNFCVQRLTHWLESSSSAKERKGEKKHKSKIAVRAVVVMGWWVI